MRSTTYKVTLSALVVLSTALVSSSAMADAPKAPAPKAPATAGAAKSSVRTEDGPKKPSKAKPKTTPKTTLAVAVAVAVDPLPPLPPPEPAASAPPVAASPTAQPAPSQVDRPGTPASREVPLAGPGFVLSFGSGGGVLLGEAVKDLGVTGGFVTLDVRVGAYVTERIGILGGVQAGYGVMNKACSECNAYTYQLPVVAQYAFVDRARGPYVEGGLGLFTTYAGYTKKSSSPETVSLRSTVDLKVAVGIRIPLGAPSKDKAPTTACDIRLGFDLGRFTSLEYKSVRSDVSGDIRDDRRAMHYLVGLLASYHFAP